LYEEIRQNSVQAVQKDFTLSIMAERYRDIYEKVSYG